MPIGVASISFTLRMPSACTLSTCSGSFCPLVAAASPGTRLSKISVVLPLPLTPVTTVSLPLGISTASGFTVWMAPVSRWRHPAANISSAAACLRITELSAFKNGPILEFLFCAISVMVPSAITCPPLAPASGPISISQPASFKIWVSWSTSTTELPSATKSCITPVSPTMLEGCSPMEGSSSTYKTPVVRLRTARASCMRWRSPVERVLLARSSVK